MKPVDTKTTTTLLLNHAFRPVGLLTARDAFCCFFNNKMSAFDKDFCMFKNHEDWYNGLPSLHHDHPCLRSSSDIWAIPTILQTDKKFVYNQKRRRVTLKDMCTITQFTCQICHKKHPYEDLTREHIVPRALGGTNDLSNLTITCKKCNNKKGHIHPYYDIHGQPLKPIKEIFSKPSIEWGKTPRPEWEHFIGKEAV